MFGINIVREVKSWEKAEFFEGNCLLKEGQKVFKDANSMAYDSMITIWWKYSVLN